MAANTSLIPQPGITSYRYRKRLILGAQNAPPPNLLALQALQNNNYYLVQMHTAHLKATALPAAALPVQAPPPLSTHNSQPANRRIGYIPMAREAQARQNDTANDTFRLTKGPYTEYGSTDGGWRDVPCGRRFVLPDNCAPRRSKRLM
jgi:hypothetical protein